MSEQGQAGGLVTIARYRGAFSGKFGIPRQSGLAPDLEGLLVFEPAFQAAQALRGLEGFSHIWLIWGFSEQRGEGWSPTVRPPRLGGDKRVGVFASRSPNRPNPLGLSLVRLAGIRSEPGQPLALLVLGADLMDGSPVYDIKPYLPYADQAKGAHAGYAEAPPEPVLQVDFPQPLLERFAPDARKGLLQALALDPRPAYQDDPQRVYGFLFQGKDVRFRVVGDTLRVVEIRH